MNLACISEQEVSGEREKTRLQDPNSESLIKTPVEKILIKQEREKKNNYNQRIMSVEYGTFTPLVFSIHGSTRPECSVYHANLADKIATKTGDQYTNVLSLIQCKLSFISIRSALLCLRGSRKVTNKNHTKAIDDITLSCNELKL